MSSDLRKPPFRSLSEAVVEGACDRELEHAVAEKLEPLVGFGTVIGPRGMREDLLEPSRRKLGDQSAELVQPGRVGLSFGAR